MMNIYTGNVTPDTQGDATVQLPERFEALNTDFRYQLTVIGQFAQAIVARKIENHQFTIRSGKVYPRAAVLDEITPIIAETDKDVGLTINQGPHTVSNISAPLLAVRS
jgi:hypothetical protein